MDYEGQMIKNYLRFTEKWKEQGIIYAAIAVFSFW